MWLSELDAKTVKAFARIDTDDDALIEGIFLPAARAHVLAYTGLSIYEADEKPDLAAAALALCSHLYDHRDAVADKSQMDCVIESFLGAHSVNLV